MSNITTNRAITYTNHRANQIAGITSNFKNVNGNYLHVLSSFISYLEIRRSVVARLLVCFDEESRADMEKQLLLSSWFWKHYYGLVVSDSLLFFFLIFFSPVNGLLLMTLRQNWSLFHLKHTSFYTIIGLAARVVVRVCCSEKTLMCRKLMLERKPLSSSRNGA